MRQTVPQADKRQADEPQAEVPEPSPLLLGLVYDDLFQFRLHMVVADLIRLLPPEGHPEALRWFEHSRQILRWGETRAARGGRPFERERTVLHYVLGTLGAELRWLEWVTAMPPVALDFDGAREPSSDEVVFFHRRNILAWQVTEALLDEQKQVIRCASRFARRNAVRNMRAEAGAYDRPAFNRQDVLLHNLAARAGETVRHSYRTATVQQEATGASVHHFGVLNHIVADFRVVLQDLALGVPLLPLFDGALARPEWAGTPAKALGGKSPLECLQELMLPREKLLKGMSGRHRSMLRRERQAAGFVNGRGTRDAFLEAEITGEFLIKTREILEGENFATEALGLYPRLPGRVAHALEKGYRWEEDARSAYERGSGAPRTNRCDPPVDALGSVPSFEEGLLRRLEAERALLEAKLSPSEAEVFLLFHADGLSYEEIAARCGTSSGAVGSFLSRARKKLSAAQNE